MRFQTLRTWYAREPLLFQTILAVFFGIIIGLMIGTAQPSEMALYFLGFLGEILLRSLKMMVLPLVSVSMICGICSVSSTSASVGKMARRTFLFYLGCTFFAILLGLLLVLTVQPGVGASFGGNSTQTIEAPPIAGERATGDPTVDSLVNVARNFFPENIVAAAANLNILGVIMFSLLFGSSLASLGEEGRPARDLMVSLNAVVMKMIGVIMKCMPIGIFSIVLAKFSVGPTAWDTFGSLGRYVVVYLLGLFVMAALFLPLVYWITVRANPLRVMRVFSSALITGFSTDSSAATLPVTIGCAVDGMGVAMPTAQFVLPLGATMNMNGTALYEAMTVIFIAQMHGIPLSIGQTIVIVITSTFAAVGAASIPSAGLVTMVMVLEAVSLGQYTNDLSVFFAVDWLFDRFRTVVNILGDCYAAVIVDHLNKGDAPPLEQLEELDEL